MASEAADYVRYEFFESKNTSLKFVGLLHTLSRILGRTYNLVVEDVV